MQMGQSGRDLTSQYGQAMQGRYMQGIQTMGGASSLLGQVATKQMGVQENITQAAIGQRNAQAQAEMAANQRAGSVYTGMGEMGSSFMGSTMQMGQQAGGGWDNPYDN